MTTLIRILTFVALLFAVPALAQTQQNGLGPVGNPPGKGFGAIDGAWALGVANGVNYGYQYGLTATGTTQATCTPLPTQTALVEFDTVASSTGGCLPPALPGTSISLYNNGAQTLTVYPNIANNVVTGVQDTINNSTSVSVSSHAAAYFFCAKQGIWAEK